MPNSQSKLSASCLIYGEKSLSDGSGNVDLSDWAYMAQYWMAEAADEHWDAAVNLNGANSDVVDWTDMLILLDHWLWDNR